MTDWPTIVGDHGPLVWRTAYRLVGNHEDAADCFQRTFLAAVELEAAEPVRHWPAVLARLATARALDVLRARHRASRVGVLADDPPAGGPGPLADASAGELAAALRVALSDIDPVQAEVFCLAAVDGWSHHEVADHLGTTANHVGVLLHRARAELRPRLRAFAPAAEEDHP